MKTTRHIILSGPESSAKTDLATFLTKELNGILVSEYAREYLEKKDPPLYTVDEVLHMAFTQFQRQLEALSTNAKFIFSDTGMLNYMIWSKYKYGFVPTQIFEWFLLQKSDLHLLCFPDIPWKSDPLRENPDDRMALFTLYEAVLNEYQLPYQVVKGIGEDRKESAMNAVFKNI